MPPAELVPFYTFPLVTAAAARDTRGSLSIVLYAQGADARKAMGFHSLCTLDPDVYLEWLASTYPIHVRCLSRSLRK